MTSAESLTTIPNLLSLSRIPLSILLFVAIEWSAWPIALAIFCLAMITDWLDGWWARHYSLQSQIGRSLDPLTDKVLIGGTFIFLLMVPGAYLQPWMVALVICRELLVTGVRGMVEATGQSFGADWFGKLKTVLQTATLIAILTFLALPESLLPTELAFVLSVLTIGLVYAMLIATLGSGLQYIVKAKRLLHKD